MKKVIKVLIVEDSNTAAEYLSMIFNEDPRFDVIGIARDGKQGVDMAEALKPDIISMDINLPHLDGFKATRIIMETNPVPIIIVSSSFSNQDVEKTFKALNSGALAVIEKPHGIYHKDHVQEADKIKRLFNDLSEVKVITRKNIDRKVNILNTNFTNDVNRYQCVAIGTSTGGPGAVSEIFSNIDKAFKLPILLVQHISLGFTDGFVKHLNSLSNLPLKIAVMNEILKPGVIYVAPESLHMGVTNGRIKLSDEPPIMGNKPSVSYLFDSIAKNYMENAIGILLTGMGRDGSFELKNMKEQGALTIIQDKESSVIFGMPGEAKKVNAHCLELNPMEIAKKLNQINNLIKN